MSVPRRNRIQESWLEYKNKVMPPTAPPIQIQECRRAFYSGAVAMFSVYQELGDEGISEEVGVKILSDMGEEAAEFVQRVMEGRA